jgi:hypothetical protein
MVLPVPQATNPLLQALASMSETAGSSHARIGILAHAAVLVLQIHVLAIITSNSDRIAAVERSVTFGLVVVFHKMRVVFHLDAIVIDLVCLQSTIERESGLGLAVQVFWVVVLVPR